MIVWISCILAGLSFCLCLYLLLSPASRAVTTPQAYRQNKALVLLWPWIHGLGRTLLPWMSWAYRARLLSLLRHAGLERAAQIDHIAGAQGLAGCIVFVCAAVFQRHRLFEHPLLVLFIASVMATAGSALPLLWLRDRAKKRQERVLRELPFFLDMTTLCIEAGQNLQGALHQTAELCPAGILRDELRYCLSEMRTGRPRVEALRAMAVRTGVVEVSHWVATIAQAEKMGMGLGPLLRSQSEQRRRERFNRAEKRALEAPVKMLLPLIFCIFSLHLYCAGVSHCHENTASGHIDAFLVTRYAGSLPLAFAGTHGKAGNRSPPRIPFDSLQCCSYVRYAFCLVRDFPG